MRVLIATVQVPFIRGGAESHAENLRAALRAAGHEAEIVAVPYAWDPPELIVDHILACRLLNLEACAGLKVDRVVGLKFPAYLIPHPNKVLWILHQHRQAYELWDHPLLGDLNSYPNGTQIRDAIRQADRKLIPEAKRVFANSANVARRLKRFCRIESEPLYHPPPSADAFFCAEAEDYLFFPSRLSPGKRQRLVLEALALARPNVRVLFAGASDHPRHAEEFASLARELKLGERARWLGPVSEKKKREHYARALGVVYPPVDEDYGYVTLEAMLASKPVITCADSGGPLEFVRAGETGLVAEPTPESLAAAMDELWKNRARSRAWGRAGRARYDALDINWRNVVAKLLE